MAVEAVVGDVELSVRKPFRVRQVPFEDFRGSLEPLDHLCLFSPVFFGVGQSLLIHLLVIFERFDVSLLAEILRRRDGLFFENVWIKFLHCSSGGRAHAKACPGWWQVLRRSARPSLRYSRAEDWSRSGITR